MATPARSTAQNAKPQWNYFVDQKKGEVNELKALLRNQAVERDPKRKREVVKKVIAYMTLGFDVSRLFGEMVMASSTSDIIMKKMCYLYLSNYAASNEELATLCINTMTKDCQDSDPLVRGLALRSLSSLRLTSTLEYLIPVLNQGLSDNSPYVRRNAVMAVLKLFDLDKSAVRDSGMMEALRSKVYDRDPQVSASALMVLGEVLLEEGGIELDSDLVVNLLNRIKEYSEWGQCIILSLVVRYKPADDDQVYAILNILDGCLRVANSAVVLATAKIFMRYADALRHIKEQIYFRLKQPMLTLMATACHETRYAVLKHVEIMVSRCPGVFDDEFKQFFCHYNEPSHLKFVKLRILPELTNEENVHELVQELSEYVNDISPEIAKRAINSFGRIAVKIPGGADGIINQLLEFISMDADYVRTQVVIVIKDLLRKYPDRARDVLPALPRCMRRVEDPIGKAAVIFMLGEFGKNMRQSPYLLEPVIEAYEDETSVEVKVTLLTAVLKLFFARPPEVHGMLNQLLTIMVNDTSESDLHDRALFYYRLLRQDVEEAKRCITCWKDPVSTFSEERLGGLQQQLFEEFNTLAVMYDKPAEQFVDEMHMVDNGYFFYTSTTAPESSVSHSVVESTRQNNGSPDRHYNSPATTNSVRGDMDDLLGFGGSSYSTTASSGKIPWALEKGIVVDQVTFQNRWETLTSSASLDLYLDTLPSAEQVEKLAAENQIYCMASGDLGTALKFFFFGKDNNSVFHFAEVQLEKDSRHLTATIKSDDSSDSQTFADSFMASLGSLL